MRSQVPRIREAALLFGGEVVFECFYGELRFPLGGVGGGGFFLRVHQAELFHFVAQGVAADVQQPCGVRLVAAGLAQRQFHQRALHFFE